MQALTPCSAVHDRFRGCLVGALVGDCLGAPFEGKSVGPHTAYSKEDIFRHIDLSEKQEVTLTFTDDTQMTQEIADSLLENHNFVAEDLAKRFVTRFYADGLHARYGASVIHIFKKLKDSNFVDPYLPAKQQFGGSGSYGNGAAMRIAPVVLFQPHDVIDLLKLVELTATLTHTHKEGIDGALFQSLAIRRCLMQPITSAKEFLKPFKNDLINANISEVYIKKLKEIKSLLKKRKKITSSVVFESLGNGVAALKSVPTALFCFLRGLKPIAGFHETDPFRRVMEYAISLGGDTDTIASMAGAITGANFGLDAVHVGTRRSCQQIDRVIKQADGLYEIFCHDV